MGDKSFTWYKNIILHDVLCGCEIWTLTENQENKFWVLDSRVVSSISRRKTEIVTEEWRKLYDKELHNLNSSKNITTATKLRKIKLARNVVRMGIMNTSNNIMSCRPKAA